MTSGPIHLFGFVVVEFEAWKCLRCRVESCDGFTYKELVARQSTCTQRSLDDTKTKTSGRLCYLQDASTDTRL